MESETRESINTPRLVIVLAFFLSVPAPAAYGLDAGLRAYRSGDYSKAFQLWLPEAKLGDGDAQYHIGLLYRDGQGVSKDLDEALRWLRLSAGHGFDPGQTELGWFLAKGMGGPADYAEARKWCEKAVAQGNPRAKNLLGILYLNGRGVQQDYGRAFQLFYDASKNSKPATYNVGYMYERGYGRQQDLVEAGAWYSIAADKGEPGAKEKWNEITARLSPEESSALRWRARKLYYGQLLGDRWRWEFGLNLLCWVLAMLQLGLAGYGYLRSHLKWKNDPALDRRFSGLAGTGLRRWLLLYRPQGAASMFLHMLFFAGIASALAAVAALPVVTICIALCLPVLRWAAITIDKKTLRQLSRLDAAP
jgi:hypothetical protein